MPPTRTDMPGPLNPHNDAPSWPTNTQQPRFGQQMPQPPTTLGYDYSGNQNAYGGGYANPPPPTYYTEGYSGSPNYPPAGRFAPPPYGQRPIGWGNPYQYQQDRPSNEAMDIDEQPTYDPRTTTSIPRRRSPARQNPRRDRRAPTPQRRDIPYRSRDLFEENPTPTASAQGGSRTSTRGKAKATTEDINRQEIGERQNQLTELLDRLSAIDIDHSLGDFMEREELAQLVVRQLLDHIDRLQADLDRERKARRSAEAQLVNTIWKRPAPPHADLPLGSEPRSIKKLRSDIGDGDSVSSFSDAPSRPPQLRHLSRPDESHPASTESNPRMGRVALPVQTKEEATKIKTER